MYMQMFGCPWDVYKKGIYVDELEMEFLRTCFHFLT
jgi:hypothetical protein